MIKQSITILILLILMLCCVAKAWLDIKNIVVFPIADTFAAAQEPGNYYLTYSTNNTYSIDIQLPATGKVTLTFDESAWDIFTYVETGAQFYFYIEGSDKTEYALYQRSTGYTSPEPLFYFVNMHQDGTEDIAEIHLENVDAEKKTITFSNNGSYSYDHLQIVFDVPEIQKSKQFLVKTKIDDQGKNGNRTLYIEKIDWDNKKMNMYLHPLVKFRYVLQDGVVSDWFHITSINETSPSSIAILYNDTQGTLQVDNIAGIHVMIMPMYFISHNEKNDYTIEIEFPINQIIKLKFDQRTWSDFKSVGSGTTFKFSEPRNTSFQPWAIYQRNALGSSTTPEFYFHGQGYHKEDNEYRIHCDIDEQNQSIILSNLGSHSFVSLNLSITVQPSNVKRIYVKNVVYMPGRYFAVPPDDWTLYNLQNYMQPGSKFRAVGMKNNVTDWFVIESIETRKLVFITYSQTQSSLKEMLVAFDFPLTQKAVAPAPAPSAINSLPSDLVITPFYTYNSLQGTNSYFFTMLSFPNQGGRLTLKINNDIIWNAFNTVNRVSFQFFTCTFFNNQCNGVTGTEVNYNMKNRTWKFIRSKPSSVPAQTVGLSASVDEAQRMITLMNNGQYTYQSLKLNFYQR